ncbi:hypothetical protein [Cereibacter sphaeroides]|uniref:hypothetical protein n=1 Tax=Cereibacter sphaeroides TaxID=1063 RepID=UPI001F3C8288|nr:hypothetical protein [Cereibacter sphaeroides]MCE6969748.1 hypothetical protein [Cereibacter sphaeroides]
MSAKRKTSGQVRVTLVSAAEQSGVAADVIASHLGLDRLAVIRNFVRQPAVLAEAVPEEAARHLAPLLSAMGVTIRIEPAGSPETAVMVEVAIQPVRVPTEATIGRLSSHLRIPPDAVRAGLHGLNGMVLSLSAREADALRRALRRDSGLRVAISRAPAARYDLFLRRGCTLTPELATLLRRLGLSRCDFSGAVGAGLDARTAQVVMERHGDLVDALNRDFQRFDLFLAAGHDLGRPDLADFVATRSRIRRERLLAPGGAQGVRLEAGLTRAAARRFHADYTAIGLETRIALVATPTSSDP